MRPGQRNAGPTWKPRVCADCPARHPSFNLDGGKAGTPWRCGPCNAKAAPMPADDLFGAVVPPPAPQGSLL